MTHLYFTDLSKTELFVNLEWIRILRTVLPGIILATSLLLVGCASIVNKKLVEVPVHTNPPDAKVTVRGHEIRSPGKLQLARGKGNYQATIEKEGYETVTLVLKQTWDPWMWGDILFGGPIGLAFDLMSRQGYGLEPKEINYNLLKKVNKGSHDDEVHTSNSVPPSSTLDVDFPPIRKLRTRKNVHAIVIGIEQYQYLAPKADFASNDARTTVQYLIRTLGYPEENIVLLLNERATKSYIEKYVEGWLPDRVEPGDSVFIYFSGHGTSNFKKGKGYLVPYDGDPSFIEQTGYSLDRLYERLGTLPASDVVVILDSCFSGAGGRSVIAKGTRPAVLYMENQTLASGKVMVLAASSGDQVSSTYQERGHGLLTYFFLKGLQGEADQNGDNRIELRELFEYLKPQVERMARRDFHNEQTPQLLGGRSMLDRGITLIDGNR